MRAAGAACLLATLLLAGCADDAPPLAPGEPTFSDAELPPGDPLPPLTWQRIHEGSFVIAPASPYSASVTVPTGTLQALVNFTLASGGTANLRLTLGECAWRRDVPLVMGQSFGADCGGLSSGDDALLVSVEAGAIQGTISVDAIVCVATRGCPAPAPVPSG